LLRTDPVRMACAQPALRAAPPWKMALMCGQWRARYRGNQGQVWEIPEHRPPLGIRGGLEFRACTDGRCGLAPTHVVRTAALVRVESIHQVVYGWAYVRYRGRRERESRGATGIGYLYPAVCQCSAGIVRDSCAVQPLPDFRRTLHHHVDEGGPVH
jgi:hypothetical protein